MSNSPSEIGVAVTTLAVTTLKEVWPVSIRVKEA